jgi:hypothetical protein
MTARPLHTLRPDPVLFHAGTKRMAFAPCHYHIKKKRKSTERLHKKVTN